MLACCAIAAGYKPWSARDFRKVARVSLMRTGPRLVASSVSRYAGNGRTLCAGLIIPLEFRQARGRLGSASLWTDTTDDELADAAEDFGLSIKTATWNTDAT